MDIFPQEYDFEQIEQSIVACEAVYCKGRPALDWRRSMFSVCLNGRQDQISVNDFFKMLILRGMAARQIGDLLGRNNCSVNPVVVRSRAEQEGRNLRAALKMMCAPCP